MRITTFQEPLLSHKRQVLGSNNDLCDNVTLSQLAKRLAEESNRRYRFKKEYYLPPSRTFKPACPTIKTPLQTFTENSSHHFIKHSRKHNNKLDDKFQYEFNPSKPNLMNKNRDNWRTTSTGRIYHSRIVHDEQGRRLRMVKGIEAQVQVDDSLHYRFLESVTCSQLDMNASDLSSFDLSSTLSSLTDSRIFSSTYQSSIGQIKMQNDAQSQPTTVNESVLLDSIDTLDARPNQDLLKEPKERGVKEAWMCPLKAGEKTVHGKHRFAETVIHLDEHVENTRGVKLDIQEKFVTDWFSLGIKDKTDTSRLMLPSTDSIPIRVEETFNVDPATAQVDAQLETPEEPNTKPVWRPKSGQKRRNSFFQQIGPLKSNSVYVFHCSPVISEEIHAREPLY